MLHISKLVVFPALPRCHLRSFLFLLAWVISFHIDSKCLLKVSFKFHLNNKAAIRSLIIEPGWSAVFIEVTCASVRVCIECVPLIDDHKCVTSNDKRVCMNKCGALEKSAPNGSVSQLRDRLPASKLNIPTTLTSETIEFYPLFITHGTTTHQQNVHSAVGLLTCQNWE